MPFKEVNFNDEVERLYKLYLKHRDDAFEIYENQEEYIEKYLFGKATPMHRGYYNPTLAAHLAIGGNQKGPKPKAEKRKEESYCLYGLDKEGRPIYSRSYISDNKPTHVYEVIFYLDNTILGISMDQDDLYAIHESKYIDGNLNDITFCLFNITGNPDLHNCSSIKIELYDYDSPNHFNWKLIDHSFGMNFGALSTELKKSFGNMAPSNEFTREMKYSFDLSREGKVIRMYNEKYEKIFGAKKKNPKPINSNTKESERIFNKMLSETSLNSSENFNLFEFSAIVEEFMKVKFDCAEDDLLYEVYYSKDLEGKDTFVFEFVRQFCINDENDVYEHMEQLHMTLHFELNPLFKKLSDTVWSIDLDDIQSFFFNVKKLESFKVASKVGKLKEISIYHNWV